MEALVKGFGFNNPYALLLLGFLILIVWIYIKYLEKKKTVYLKLGITKHIHKKYVKKMNFIMHLPFLFLLISMLFLIIALSDPYVYLKKAEKGVNVVLAIDVSGSMAATDYKPSRLEAAKKAAEVFIDNLHKNDNIGIVIFSSNARTLCYLTPFKERAKYKLHSLDKAEGSTAIGDGLMLAIDMVTSIPNKKKMIVLLSDGVNNAGSINPLDAARYAEKENVPVYTIGMGSNQPVLLGYDMFGNPQYAELDEETLKKIASITGGKYYKSVNEKTLEEIYSSLSQNIKREWTKQSIKDVFIWLSLLTLVLDVYIVYYKYKLVA